MRPTQSILTQFSEDGRDDHDDYGLIRETKKFYKSSEIFQNLKQRITDVSQMYELDFDATLMILNYYRFNVDKLESEFSIDSSFVFEKLHIQRSKTVSQLPRRGRTLTRRTRKSITCRSCYMDSDECESLECGHEFCIQCWQMYITSKIDEYILFPHCMESGCHVIVPYGFIEAKLQSEASSLNRYYVRLCKLYIDEQQYQNLLTWKWCPGQDCDYCVQNLVLEDSTIQCPNQHQWCFMCRRAPHKPVSCQIVESWENLISQSDETVKWILEFTKLCAFCKRPVERNQGCLFIYCRPPGGCGKNFCYQCSQAWEPTHTDHFKCPNENIAQVQDKSGLNVHILATYNTHYQNYALCNQRCTTITEQLLPQAKMVQDAIVSKFNINPQKLVFIKESLQAVRDTSYQLKWTYCLSHQIENSRNLPRELEILNHHQEAVNETCKELLAIIQEQLYNKVEQLSDRTIQNIKITETELEELKSKVIQQVIKLQRCLKTITTEVEKGSYFNFH